MNINNIAEKFSFKTHKSPVKLLLSIIGTFIIFDIILLLTFAFFNFFEIDKNWIFWFFSFGESLVTLFLFIYVIIFIVLFIRWFVNYYEIKEWSILQYNGVFIKRKEVYIISDISRLELNQTFFWRIFDYWDVIIWYNDSKIIFRFIQYPNQFINNLQLIKNLSQNHN